MGKLKVSDVKVGRRYRMADNSLSRFGLPQGTEVKVTYKSGTHIDVQHPDTNSAYSSSISSIENLLSGKEELNAELKKHEDSIAIIKAKLKWLDDTKSEKFDDEEFRVWQVLETLENAKSTRTEKAKVIAQLIKSGK